MPAHIAPDRTRGLIIACGDVAADDRSAALLMRLMSFVGVHPRVAVLTAPEAALDDDYWLEPALLAAGAGEVRVHTLRVRADAAQPTLLDAIDHVDLIVIAPHAPLRLTTLIGGTQLARTLRRRSADGVAIGAIGAAAAILSEHMLAHGAEGATPRQGAASLAPGLGLTNRVVVDPGGSAGDRLGRLLTALSLNPFALGLGIDAGTAAVIGPDNVLDVVGSGGITVLDPAEMDESNAAAVSDGAPIRITNLRLHALTAGTRYDLDFRRAVT
ncbi:MAG TPA: cyanophycinase [Dokdonella sp.]|uniref:cyanophycinase n=1 Tax=Dokdonella sp. TaxID=2291710 RepID=UPI002C72F9A7|nr:cyanophycinase [Dokdonella sp.]HUD41788.1 cyanophycinase [Dokdonella sp.]